MSRSLIRAMHLGALMMAHAVAGAQASPHAFNFGPYRLGMSQVEAKRALGVGACTHDSEKAGHLACDVAPLLQGLVVSVHRATIVFNAKTSALVKINVTLKDGDLAGTMQRLNIQTCPKPWRGSWGAEGITGWCYRPPNQVRRIEIQEPCRHRHCSKSTIASFYAQFDAQHVSSFLRMRKATQAIEGRTNAPAGVAR